MRTVASCGSRSIVEDEALRLTGSATTRFLQSSDVIDSRLWVPMFCTSVFMIAWLSVSSAMIWFFLSYDKSSPKGVRRDWHFSMGVIQLKSLSGFLSGNGLSVGIEYAVEFIFPSLILHTSCVNSTLPKGKRSNTGLLLGLITAKKNSGIWLLGTEPDF